MSAAHPNGRTRRACPIAMHPRVLAERKTRGFRCLGPPREMRHPVRWWRIFASGDAFLRPVGDMVERRFRSSTILLGPRWPTTSSGGSDRLARSLRRRSSRDFAQRCLGCTVCACTGTVADIIRPPGAQAGGLRALASARPGRAGKGLSTLSRYEPAMCDDGNPCARRRRARPRGARAGNLGHLRIECRDRGAAVGATARPCRPDRGLRAGAHRAQPGSAPGGARPQGARAGSGG